MSQEGSDTRRTRRVAALVTDPVHRLVREAADRAGVSMAALVRAGAVREAERVLEGRYE